MQGKLKELWLIMECPNCQRPNTANKYVLDGKILRLLEPMSCNCPICETSYTIVLKQGSYELEM